MESSEANSSCGDVRKLSSKNLQIGLLDHCIICLRKVNVTRKGSRRRIIVDSEDGSTPEIVPKSVTSTPGFLATFNQIWAVLQTKWKEKNTPKKDGSGSSSEEIGISLENVLLTDSVSNVSFSSSPTICQYCCDRVLEVENLMKAVRQQVREINILFETGRRREARAGGSGDFEKSLRKERLEKNVIRTIMQFAGIFDNVIHEDVKEDECCGDGANRSVLMKTESDEESGLAISHDICSDGTEDQIRGMGDEDVRGDPDYIKSEEELEGGDDDQNDESEYEMGLDGNDKKEDPNCQVEMDPLTLIPDKRKKSRRKPNKLRTRKETNEEDDNKFPCTCGASFSSWMKRKYHMKQNKELHPEYEMYVKGHIPQICELCGKKIRLSDIQQHLTEDHFNGQAEYVIRCPNEKCRYMYASWNRLQLHLKHSVFNGCKQHWKEKGGYFCESCGFKGTTFLKMKNHVRDKHENDKEKKLRCPISGCRKLFCVKQSVNYHLYEHRYCALASEQVCDKCGEKLKVEEMEEHFKDKHGVNEVVGCKQCGMKFPGREEMVEHLFEHRDNGLRCDICGEDKFGKYSDFREHLFGVHKLYRKKYKCGECENWYWRQDEKEDHELRMHKKKDATGLSLQYRQAFVIGRGEGKKGFECKLCDVKFVLERSLISHNIKVHGEDPFRCDICGETFHDKTKFSRHKKEHAGVEFQKEWKCEVEGCGKSFKVKWLWKYHKESGHGGVKQHVCEECGKGFTLSQSLKHRDTVHLGLRRWVCDECGERFTSGTTLKKHKLIHTGERPFACEICGQRFRHKDVLKTHLKSHEGKGAEFKPNGPMKQIRKRKAQ